MTISQVLVKETELATVEVIVPGPAGVGSAWQQGAGAPSSGVGGIGDFYLNTTNGDIYGPKTSSGWGSVVFNIAEGQQGPAGPAGAAGPQGPAGAVGAQGPAGPAGATGPAGPAGAAGINGKTVLSGSGAPTSGVGTDGDFFIDVAASRIYGPRASGAWGSGTSLIGPAGAAGAAGATGPQGPAGPAGAAGAQGPAGVVAATAPIAYDAGTQTVAISAATTSAAGSMSPADKTKLDGIASGATANSSDATLLARANHTGTQSASTITGLATVATTGAYTDLSGRPTLGTAAAQNVGTAAGNVVQLDGSAKLPAVDGSALTGLPPGITDLGYTASTRLLASSTGADVTLPLFDTASSNAGLVPGSSTGGTANFLRADGTWAAPPSSPPGGSTTQIQFNDDGVFGGDADLTYNKTTNLLTTKGDVSLDDGGSFTTTLQTITPTANRTLSLPDATGTVALVAGSSGNLLYNNAGANAGVSTLNFDGSILTLSGRLINSYSSIASSPAKALTGTWFTGGTATTTKPHFLVEPAGTTSTAWSTSGTGLGVNAASGFAGRLLDLQVNGTSQFTVSSAGAVTASAGTFNSFPLDGTGGTADVIGRGARQLWLNNTGLAFGSNLALLVPDGGHSFGIRNGTNAQTFRVYNTFTSSTNYELGKLEWSSSVFRIGTEKGSGGGTARALELQTDGTTRLTVAATGSTITAASGTALVADHRLTGTAPASATATGTAGDIRYDADYVYICTATNTWKRAALSTW